MLKISVEYFGPSKQFTDNISSEEITLENGSLIALFLYLHATYGLSFVKYVIRSCGMALNYEYIELDINAREIINSASDETLSEILAEIFQAEELQLELKNGDEVAIIPPVSAG
ncbi:hypothetical protein PACTADRAFT_78029 [Pachysolen tannophilus NRRL Y-2460]|uniref:Molybdopterin synthase sulfur carrier subunit n=1 Tax=Pachysolen tannophilus NRRL Y-2460 TaxID=669874 RepID=A0A1E4U0P3_PACTA|nr:hypothetical protein PACTADRAFT_78029 [Pachysolen tannophilus NRRL Y-2460]